jgi:hypothetical protein
MWQCIRDIRFTVPQFFNNHWPVFVWCLLYTCIAGALQYHFALFVEGDVPYHAAVGRLISKHGILDDFPWTPFSWLSENYADDRLLFHLLYVPFAHLEWKVGAKIVGTIAGATILVSLYLILRAERIRFAGLWALIPLAGSVLFISRFLLVRPHLLSIALALIFLWAAARSRLVVLAAVSALYPLTYIAFWQLPCLLLVAAETAHFLSGKRIRWRPAAVVLAGITLGVLIHPHSVNLLEYNWIVMNNVLFKVSWLEEAGFDMGAELQPIPLGAWVQGLIVSVFMTIAAVIYSLLNRRKDVLPLVFTLAAVGFCALTIRSARFAEYFVPFSTAAFAFASRSMTWRFLVPAILTVSMLYTMWVGSPTFSAFAIREIHMLPRTKAFLNQAIPRESLVFTNTWNNGLLMLKLPYRKFLVALDPTLFYLKDPKLYRSWYELTHEAPPGVAREIRERFGIRYVIVKNRHPFARKLNYQLSLEPGVRMLLNSRKWTFFYLGSPEKSNTDNQEAEDFFQDVEE